MGFTAEKIVLALVSLPSLCCGLMLLAVFVPRPGARALVLGLATALLWGASMPWTAGQLMLGVWREFPPVNPAALPRAPLIVVLGGGLGQPGQYRRDPEWNDASDRLVAGARLFHAGRAPQILVSGGQPRPRPEAFYMHQALGELGVPAGAVVEEDTSRNTRENARFVARWLAAHAPPARKGETPPPVLLVTSAWHMARAVEDFRAEGVAVVPAPCDYPFMPGDIPGVRRFLPDADALAVVQHLQKEALGRLARRLKGGTPG